MNFCLCGRETHKTGAKTTKRTVRIKGRSSRRGGKRRARKKRSGHKNRKVLSCKGFVER
jgi:hypothetical protein